MESIFRFFLFRKALENPHNQGPLAAHQRPDSSRGYSSEAPYELDDEESVVA